MVSSAGGEPAAALAAAQGFVGGDPKWNAAVALFNERAKKVRGKALWHDGWRQCSSAHLHAN
jgi:hypothetical protein